jgi:phosphate-selective porin OprO/OprP
MDSTPNQARPTRSTGVRTAPCRRPTRTVLLAAFLVSRLVAVAAAADRTPPAGIPEPGETLPAIFNNYPLENLGRLYHNDTNPWVQEVWFLGRYHGQAHIAEGSVDNDKGWENRRFRIGGQARLFQKLTIHAQMVSGNDLQMFYNGFTELWVGWRFNDAITLTVGQQKHRFTHDRNVSSRYLNYLERGMLTNMFALDYTPAVTLAGKVIGWTYYAGVFSNATGKDMIDSFGDYDSGYSILATATRDLGKFAHDGTAILNVSAVYSDAHSEATNLNRFDGGIASALILTKGPGSLVTELTAGFNDDKGDACGINFQPGWFLTERMQLVGRYQYTGSNDDDGLTAQRRYERSTGMGTGDSYNAAYLGANYHVAEHRLKFMSGVEYSSLGGEDVWTYSFAVRLFWGPHSKGAFPMAQVLSPIHEPD